VLPLRGHISITPLARASIRASVLAIFATATYLAWEYRSLPPLLAVHFAANGAPNGWQFKTIGRVFSPALVQVVLLAVFSGIAALLVWRRTDADHEAPETRAAASAAEAIWLMAAIWIAVQGYAAFALVTLWQTVLPRLVGYRLPEMIGAVLTVWVAVRVQRKLGRPEPLPYEPSHWRLGQLYCNPAHPALFVPTRDGRRWTLNFGRPAAALLLGAVLAAGVVLPLALLMLALRT
jgi:uncharacterized membrane protein